MKFIIPTYQRADRVRTVGYLHDKCGIPYTDIILCVQTEEDLAAYSKAFPDCVVNYRPGNNGAMNSNNCIIYGREHFPGEDFIMLDDDFDYILILRKEGNRKTAIYEPLVGPEFLQVVTAFFEKARKVGATVWGLTVLDNPFFMRLKIVRNALMTGCFLGFVNGGGDILMDESYFMKYDYEMILRLWQTGHTTLKYCMIAPRTNNRAPGGCTESRKAHTEEEFADRLLAEYGGLIRRDAKKPGEIKTL